MRSATVVPVNPMRVRRSNTSTSPKRSPKMVAVPTVGNNVVLRICMSVLLPAPFAPMTTQRSPGSARHDTSLSNALPDRTTVTWSRSNAADMTRQR